MTVVCPLHRHFSPAHLVEVMEEMHRRGAPVLRGYFDEPSGAWFAREGTHRLRSAHLLGLAPVLVPVPWWRTRAALERARFAAIEYGYAFPTVFVGGIDWGGQDWTAEVACNSSNPVAR